MPLFFVTFFIYISTILIFVMGKKRKPMDIWFLEQRLENLVEQEDYERAARVKRWIDELEILYAEREKAIVK